MSPRSLLPQTILAPGAPIDDGFAHAVPRWWWEWWDRAGTVGSRRVL